MPENQTVIPLPDTSKLEVISFEPMLQLKVVDAATCAQAAQNKDAAKKWIADVEALFSTAKAAANKAHKDICALEKKLMGIAPDVVKHSIAQADAYTKAERQKQEAVVREAQRQQEAAARKLAEEQRQAALAAAEAAKAALMPWDEPDAPEPIPEPPLAPATAPIMLAPVKAEGFKEKFKPWNFRLKEGGLLELVKAIAAGKVSLYDEFGTPILELNQPHFKNAAKRLEDQLETRYPGVEGFRETSLS